MKHYLKDKEAQNKTKKQKKKQTKMRRRTLSVLLYLESLQQKTSQTPSVNLRKFIHALSVYVDGI